MSLDPASVGLESPPEKFEYDFRTLALYALGIGAKADELDYLYEGRGPKVYPTFAVVPAFEPVFELVRKSGGNIATMVHGAQTTIVEKPLPPEGALVTTARIDGLYDMKRLVQMLCSTESRLGGDVLCRTEWQLLFREGGGFGGPHPPKVAAPKAPDAAEPAFEHEEQTSREQALLYRLSGDVNPLHADPEFAKAVGFERGPILHGLCTYGFIARAIIRRQCDGDGSRLRSLTAQFRKPVWPGEPLKTVGYRVGSDVVFKTYAGGRLDAPVATGHATLV